MFFGVKMAVLRGEIDLLLGELKKKKNWSYHYPKRSGDFPVSDVAKAENASFSTSRPERLEYVLSVVSDVQTAKGVKHVP